MTDLERIVKYLEERILDAEAKEEIAMEDFRFYEANLQKGRKLGLMAAKVFVKRLVEKQNEQSTDDAKVV